MSYTIPKQLGTCVDKLFILQTKMDALDEQKKKLEDEYNFLETHLINQLPRNKLDGAVGRTAQCRLSKIDVGNAKDWDKLRKYIVKEDAWDLLQKRLSNTACRERWEAKKVIPGVEIFTRISLKLSKRADRKK